MTDRTGTAEAVADTDELPMVDDPEAAAQLDEGAGERAEEGQQEQQAGEGEADGQGDDELAEVEIDGKTYLVHRDLKDGYLRHGDYTRKTQDLANQRRDYETREAAFQADQEMFAAHQRAHEESLVDVARLIGVDEQLQRYARVDWQRLEAEDPARAQTAFRQYQLLKDQRAGLAHTIEAKQAQMHQEAQHAAARRLEEGHRVLARDIPNWGPELQEKLADFGRRHGLSKEEMAGIADPRHVKLLHLAFVGEEVLKKQRSAVTTKRPPAQPVRQVGSRQSPATGKDLGKDADSISDDEWLKRRNAQVDRRTEQARRRA